MDTPAPEKPPIDKWAKTKDRLGIAGAILALLLLGFMLVDGSVMNFQCGFTDFITFKCNRWDASFKPWGPDKQQ